MPPPSPPSSLSVVLADDHVIVRQGLRALLVEHGYTVVGEASDGRAAVRQCATHRPAIAILDVGMPLLNGIDAAREVREVSPLTRVLLLTMHADRVYVFAALQAGVGGYVVKTAASSDLVQAIDAVARGEIYLSSSVSRTVVEAFLAGASAPSDPLSGREREVLQLIAEGHNMKEIGDLLGISARTAETHRARIMGKLAIHDVPGLVRYALRTGLTRDPAV